MKIIKRNGEERDYDRNRIIIAVTKANNEAPEQEQMTELQIAVIEEKVRLALEALGHAAQVEEIQDLVIKEIMRQQAYSVAQLYTEYRYKQNLRRKSNSTDDSILSLIEQNNELIKQENSNKNPMIASTQRDYIAGEVSKDITMRLLLPHDVVDAHNSGILHFHDSDYFIEHIYNCCLINLEDMLQNGTVITETLIEKPHSFATAANVATQIIAQVASNQYGGQTFNLAHLAPFVDISRQRYIEQVREEGNDAGITYSEEQIKRIAERRVRKEIKAGIQTIQYQLLTLMTTNGQTPFVSMYMYMKDVPEGRTRDDLAMLIEEVLNQRIYGVKNIKGVCITPAFPKLLFVLDDTNIPKDSPYYYLRELAAKCTAKRMVPDYISEKKMLEYKHDVYGCMGCRSFLTPDRFTDNGVGNIAKAKNYEHGKHKYWGRFNQGVVTINLPDVALSSGRDMETFWQIFDKRLELCHKALRIRHERLKGTRACTAPILFAHGAIARLDLDETIDPLLYDGYSTISLGYAGLYECCVYMTGKSHTDPEAKPFALEVMKYMNDKCAQWKAEENIDYSLYGTPIESVTYKFAKAIQNRFGNIPDVTDHNYITNSYHVNVRENIDAFTKLKFEAEFQALSPGGAISYVEVPDMQNNIPAIMSLQEFMYDNIIYAEVNTKSDYCHVCGYDGQIVIKEDENGKLYWECPQCGNTDQSKMNVARRTCGYIGSQFWNQGRTQEIRDRVLHL